MLLTIPDNPSRPPMTRTEGDDSPVLAAATAATCGVGFLCDSRSAWMDKRCIFGCSSTVNNRGEGASAVYVRLIGILKEPKGDVLGTATNAEEGNDVEDAID